MKKKKVKAVYTYDELIQNGYGASSPDSMFDINRFDGLIAEYYGRSPKSPQSKKIQCKPSATVLSLSFDQSEVLLQPDRAAYFNEYVVQSSAPNMSYEEYVVDAGTASVAQSLSLMDIAIPMEEANPKQEYLVDVLHPLEEAPPALAASMEAEPAPVIAPAASTEKAPQLQPADAAAAQPAAVPPSAEATQPTESDFMEDLQSILTGQKVFDPVSRQTVEKDKLAARSSESNKAGTPNRPVAEVRNEETILDRIAQSMQYANTFDLGSVDLESRFADFDRFADLEQKTEANKKSERRPAPASTESPALRVDSADFIQDLDMIRNQTATSSSLMEEPATAFSEPTVPEIENLHLAEPARRAAYALKQRHPSVVFTSGRRNREQQAHAMAGNVVLNRRWIEQTYAHSNVRDACQRWVEEHPEKTTKEEIGQGLLEVINTFSDADLGHLSKHLSGMAFDVQPVEGGEEIKATIRGLDHLQKFLEREGGLVRWHAQFQ